MRRSSARRLGTIALLLAVAACTPEPREVPFPGTEHDAFVFATNYVRQNGGMPRDAVLRETTTDTSDATPGPNGKEGAPQIMGYTFEWAPSGGDGLIQVEVGAMRGLGGGPVERRVAQYVRNWPTDKKK